MPFSAPLHVSFGGHCVAVRSNSPDAEAFVSAFYMRLLAPSPTHIDVEVSIEQNSGGYRIRGVEERLIPEGWGRSVERQVKRAILKAVMSVRPDLLWLHAAAVARNGNALLLAGTWGSGKSTLTDQLCRAGWEYFSDDTAPVDPDTGEVLPFPQTPLMRSGPDRSLSAVELAELDKVPVRIGPGAVGTAPAAIRAIVFPSYVAGEESRLEGLSPADAVFELVPNVLNFPHHRARALQHLVQLARARPLFRLPFSDAQRAALQLLRLHDGAG